MVGGWGCRPERPLRSLGWGVKTLGGAVGVLSAWGLLHSTDCLRFTDREAWTSLNFLPPVVSDCWLCMLSCDELFPHYLCAIRN